MLTIKQAMEKIKSYIYDYFGNDINDIRLEEIDGNHGNNYNLTISFLIPNKNISPSMTSVIGAIINPYIRQYKNVIINKDNGEIESIKIYKNA